MSSHREYQSRRWPDKKEGRLDNRSSPPILPSPPLISVESKGNRRRLPSLSPPPLPSHSHTSYNTLKTSSSSSSHSQPYVSTSLSRLSLSKSITSKQGRLDVSMKTNNLDEKEKVDDTNDKLFHSFHHPSSSLSSAKQDGHENRRKRRPNPSKSPRMSSSSLSRSPSRYSRRSDEDRRYHRDKDRHYSREKYRRDDHDHDGHGYRIDNHSTYHHRRNDHHSNEGRYDRRKRFPSNHSRSPIYSHSLSRSPSWSRSRSRSRSRSPSRPRENHRYVGRRYDYTNPPDSSYRPQYDDIKDPRHGRFKRSDDVDTRKRNTNILERSSSQIKDSITIDQNEHEGKRKEKENHQQQSTSKSKMPVKEDIGPNLLSEKKDQIDEKLVQEKCRLLLRSLLNLKNIDSYEKLAQIGEGTYGKVYKGRSKATGKIVALKKVRMETEKEGFPITATREIKILTSLNRSNIVSLEELVASKASVYLVFEYMDHDLAALSSLPQISFDISHIKSLQTQLLTALDYLHEKHILHRDIKGSNLLINKKGELKLADFGLARCLGHGRSVSHMTNRVITLWYRPPELLLGCSQYGGEVDIWGVGVLFLEWLTKSCPFQGTNEISQLDAIYKIIGTPEFYAEREKFTLDYPILSTCPWASMIRPKEHYSGTLGELMDKYNLSKAGKDLVKRLLSLEPSKRITAKDALAHPFFKEEPLPSLLMSRLASLDGEWHEFEIKLQKRKKASDTSLPLLHASGHIGGGGASCPSSNSSSLKSPLSLPVGPATATSHTNKNNE